MMEDAPQRPGDGAVIEVTDLVKVYGQDTRAVDGISFGVGAGELFGFLGPNGAGKTTTIKVLATLLEPTQGSARVAGFDVTKHPAEVRKRLGLAQQLPALDAFATGRETLELAGILQRMSRAEVRQRADELLELMGLTSVAKKLTGTYSGGMRRRIDLASALMHRPPVLILDEPTEGLDPQSRTALWEELERINLAGTTMLLTTHYMEEADRLCSRLAIIDAGKIVIDGTPTDLKRSIGGDTVVLRLAASDGDLEAQRATVKRLLEDLVGTDGVTAVPEGVSLAVPNASEAVPVMLRRLDAERVTISGLQMSEPSLDTVFLKYTGRSIREEAADQSLMIPGF
ncbi:MAG TPA: ATP-binding cassette domain-containing protein [Candidatus Limnocylindria bacterium]|jgi:ABC-2 type transport system ATP-binding protein